MIPSEELSVLLNKLLNTDILSLKEVGGGDISRAFRAKSLKGDFFIKYHSGSAAFDMFEAEKTGIEAIENTESIAVPEIFKVVRYKGAALLIMQYINSRPANKEDFKKLGEQLAELHLNYSDKFGYTRNNFIGSLPQPNCLHSEWIDFYVEERLLPQIEMALRLNLLNQKIPKKTRIKEVCRDICGSPKASLLHGDLWSGNYLISSGGTPYLIDPAIYFGDAMIDLSMSRLFGGFGESFYDAYHDIHHRAENYRAQTDIYQLYYLLVHLNLFGRSYYQSVIHIIQRYFGK